MKALAVRQPWASAIMDGVKTIELRTWKTDYRGPLAIVASGKPCKMEDGEILPAGGIIGTVDLVDIRPLVPSDWKGACVYKKDIVAGVYSRHYAWVLKNPRPLDTMIPCKGKLHLFEVEL